MMSQVATPTTIAAASEISTAPAEPSPIAASSCSPSVEMPQPVDLAQTVREYLELFRFGLQPNDEQQYAKQVQVAQTLYAQEIVRGQEIISVDTVLDQWRKVPLYHPGFELQVEWCNRAGTGRVSEDQELLQIVCARVRCHSKISRVTLDKVFPLIAQNEQLAQFVLHQQLQVHGTLLYFFNTENKVVRQQVDLEFESAFGQMVEQIEATLELVNNTMSSFQERLYAWQEEDVRPRNLAAQDRA